VENFLKNHSFFFEKKFSPEVRYVYSIFRKKYIFGGIVGIWKKQPAFWCPIPPPILNRVFPPKGEGGVSGIHVYLHAKLALFSSK